MRDERGVTAANALNEDGTILAVFPEDNEQITPPPLVDRRR